MQKQMFFKGELDYCNRTKLSYAIKELKASDLSRQIASSFLIFICLLHTFCLLLKGNNPSDSDVSILLRGANI